MAKMDQARGGLGMTLTLALALIGASSPKPEVIVAVCLGIWLSSIWAFWGWASKKGLLVVAKITRPVLLIAVAGALSSLYGWWLWPTIAVSPKKVVFGTSGPTTGLGETYTFAVTNNTHKDQYNVGTVLLLNSPDWTEDDFDCQIPSDSRRQRLDKSNLMDPIFFWLEQNRTHLHLCLVVWNRLKAGESRDITLRHVKKVGSVVVTACITSSNNETETLPTVFTEDKDGQVVGQPMTIPPEFIPCALSQ